MKPKHKPPKTLQVEQDPKLLLLALNLLIEAHKSKVLPGELLDWVQKEIVAEGLSSIDEPSYKKAA
jgi:hypothetical protein